MAESPGERMARALVEANMNLLDAVHETTSMRVEERVAYDLLVSLKSLGGWGTAELLRNLALALALRGSPRSTTGDEVTGKSRHQRVLDELVIAADLARQAAVHMEAAQRCLESDTCRPDLRPV